MWASSEAVALGREGIKTVALATGLSIKTIRRGIQELQVPCFQNTQGITLDRDFTATKSVHLLSKNGAFR
ncbi:MAG: hypothetical protein QNJ53_13900 [Pleurocapsa sp. MO_192.B19]|nr:hypothetical protein [Pleurocapsa sp. MO_192.B19]